MKLLVKLMKVILKIMTKYVNIWKVIFSDDHCMIFCSDILYNITKLCMDKNSIEGTN